MPLESFGSILSFAAELESLDQSFYTAAAKNTNCIAYKQILEEFAKDGKKNEQVVLRTRRENVTEMILEPIRDFTRAPFLADRDAVETMSGAEVLSKAKELEAKAVDFYTRAAQKIKALSEVSRALALIAKKRAKHQDRLADL